MQKKKWQLYAAAVVGMVVLLVAGSYGVTQLINKTYTMPAEIPPTKYPEHAITLIVPFSAGGGVDLQARALEGVASRYLGQPVVVANKPGGAGAIGWNEALNMKPDGYTLSMTSVDMLLLPLYGVTKYHYTSALAPIAQISTSYYVMAVRADQPWQSVEDLVQYAKENPNAVKFGHSGIGSMQHVLGEIFAHSSGITVGQVPFKGGSESLKSLMGGHVQVIFASPSILQEQIKTGRLRALAVTCEQRSTNPVFASVPTFKELGMDLIFTSWRSIAVAKNAPSGVQKKLADSFKQIILDPAVKKYVENMGMELEYLDPEESKKKWVEDSDRLYRLLVETGIIEKIRAQKE